MKLSMGSVALLGPGQITLGAGPLASGEGVGYEAEASALFARMTTPPTTARKALINDLIRALKTAGVWTKLDLLYVYAAADQQAALLNWLGSSFDATAVNSPTFLADHYFAGDGLTSYLDTNFNPTTASSPQFVQNSAHLGLWTFTDNANGAGASIEVGSGNSFLRRSAAGSAWDGRPNTAAGVAIISTAPSYIGHLVWSRTASNVYEGYANGVDRGGGTTASAAIGNNNLRVLAAATAGFGVNQIGIMHCGSGLSAAEVAEMYSAFSSYVAAVAV